MTEALRASQSDPDASLRQKAAEALHSGGYFTQQYTGVKMFVRALTRSKAKA